jgi:trehalose 6-phosphate synthase/phosphatase
VALSGLANELVSNLEQMLAETHIRAVKREKFVEVKVVWARKGEVFARMTEGQPAPAFLLAAGEDATDEDLFAQLPDYAWTIHVGRTPSAARYRLPHPSDMRDLLRGFARVVARVTAVA